MYAVVVVVVVFAVSCKLMSDGCLGIGYFGYFVDHKLVIAYINRGHIWLRNEFPVFALSHTLGFALRSRSMTGSTFPNFVHVLYTLCRKNARSVTAAAFNILALL